MAPDALHHHVASFRMQPLRLGSEGDVRAPASGGGGPVACGYGAGLVVRAGARGGGGVVQGMTGRHNGCVHARPGRGGGGTGTSRVA